MMLSVVIPAYQCADTIKNTVNSILASGLSDFEAVIIDDGSTDGTAEICDALSEDNELIRCIHQDNAGVSAARNRGLREAKGDYIWFFDSDDSVDQGAMREMMAVLEEAPDMIVFGMSFDYYHNGELYRRDELLPPMEGLKHAADCGEYIFALYASNALSSLCNRIIKKDVISRLDCLLREDMFLYEDLEFSLRVWKSCDSVYFIREAIYRYRQTEDGGNAGRRLTRIGHIPDLLARIEATLDGEMDKDKILLSLFLTLAREKIAVSSKADIRTVCDDFQSWVDERGLLPSIEHRKYPMLIYKGQLAGILVKRTCSRIRHRTANWIKQNIGDFRKW